MAGARQTGAGGRDIVEPVGYAVTQFLASIGFVAGIGLAPDGLLLLAAALILSVIDLRRFREANPGLVPERPEDFQGPLAKVLTRYAAFSTGLLLGLSALAVVLVLREDARAAAIGPALIAGVATLVINWRLKLALARAGGASGPRPGADDPSIDEG